MLTAGMNQSAVRRVNTAVILRALAVSAGPRKLTELAGQTGLSRRTIEQILESLVEAGWVAELDRIPISGSAGRPARRYELRAERALLAAVRITTVDVSAVVADVRGRVLGRALRPLRAYQDPSTTLDDAADLVMEALDDAGGSVDRLRAGAIAAGGAIDDEGVVRRLVHTTRWEGVHLPGELSRRVPVPWFADNDTNLGALAERWRGVVATTTTSCGRCSATAPDWASSSEGPCTADSTGPRARSSRRARCPRARWRTVPSPH